MTILVGTLCEDGVVIGADSSATYGDGSTRTIEQPIHGKIQLVENQVIVAGTGQVGMGQRFKDIIECNRNALRQKKPLDAVRYICAAAVRDFEATKARPGQFGAMLAYYREGIFTLCEFAMADMQPELKTKDLCFVSMGSGQIIADPFLALLRKVFWPGRLPKVNEAVFATTWVLTHAIEVNTGGINGPAHIAVLSKPGKEPVAEMLSNDQLQEHLGNIKGVEQHLQAYLAKIGGAHADQAPMVPELPGGAAPGQ